jgi:hypothetical protein
MNSVSVTQRQ